VPGWQNCTRKHHRHGIGCLMWQVSMAVSEFLIHCWILPCLDECMTTPTWVGVGASGCVSGTVPLDPSTVTLSLPLPLPPLPCNLCLSTVDLVGVGHRRHSEVHSSGLPARPQHQLQQEVHHHRPVQLQRHLQRLHGPLQWLQE